MWSVRNGIADRRRHCLVKTFPFTSSISSFHSRPLHSLIPEPFTLHPRAELVSSPTASRARLNTAERCIQSIGCEPCYPTLSSRSSKLAVVLCRICRPARPARGAEQATSSPGVTAVYLSFSPGILHGATFAAKGRWEWGTQASGLGLRPSGVGFEERKKDGSACRRPVRCCWSGAAQAHPAFHTLSR